MTVKSLNCHLRQLLGRRASRQHRRRGATIVEFALTFLLFLVMVLTLLEIGRGMWTFTTLAYATRQAGRHAIVRGSENPTTLANIRQVVERHARGLEGSLITIDAVWDPEGAARTDPALMKRGDIVQIRLNYTFRLVTSPLVLAQSTVPMGSTSRMVVAN